MSEIDDYTNNEDVLESVSEYKKDLDIKYRKNSSTISEFLGDASPVVETIKLHSFYSDFLAWGVSRVIESSEFKVNAILGTQDEPVFSSVQTDYDKQESCLTEGIRLVERNGIRMAITLDGRGNIQIAVKAENQEKAKSLLLDINAYMDEHNIYKGKRLKLNGEISFLDVKQRDWESVILDASTKESVRLNTVGFLNNVDKIEELGIPPKRGIILAGDPGTGKTIICKAIMAEAENITCITTEAYGQYSGPYISGLYYLAQDLSPSLVFLEDIDFIGQEREDFYFGNPPLLTLLAEMDGITEKKAIVTVATSNFFEKLDKALSERPSRFDCVYRINRPDKGQRAELINNISNKIPCSEDVKKHIVNSTDGFTPAQVQEVLHSMAISHVTRAKGTIQFNTNDVDLAIAQINYKRNDAMGFNRTS